MGDLWIDTRPEFKLQTFTIPLSAGKVIDPWYPDMAPMEVATMVVQRGFQWNKASIPNIVRGLLDKNTSRGSAPHDLICEQLQYHSLVFNDPVHCSRLFGDRLFRAMCKHDRVAWWKRQIMFYALVANTARLGFP